jgi:GNAT superfamily N-acetyltransferase
MGAPASSTPAREAGAPATDGHSAGQAPLAPDQHGGLDVFDAAGRLDGRVLEHPRLGRIAIRRLRPDDADLLAGFFAGLSEQSRHWFHPHAFDRATAERICAGGGIQQPPHNPDRPDTPREIYWLLVVSRAGREAAAGYGFYLRWDQPQPALGIAIGDAFQNAGLGRSLMQFLLDVARSHGRSGVRLTVYDDNRRARHLYERFGFTTRRLVHHMQLDFTAPGGGPIRPSAGDAGESRVPPGAGSLLEERASARRDPITDTGGT